MRWFWLSFADPTRPVGTQFLGGCYVCATDAVSAVATAHLLGINPGGEVKIWELPAGLPACHPSNVLLTREQVEALP